MYPSAQRVVPVWCRKSTLQRACECVCGYACAAACARGSGARRAAACCVPARRRHGRQAGRREREREKRGERREREERGNDYRHSSSTLRFPASRSTRTVFASTCGARASRGVCTVCAKPQTERVREERREGKREREGGERCRPSANASRFSHLSLLPNLSFKSLSLFPFPSLQCGLQRAPCVVQCVHAPASSATPRGKRSGAEGEGERKKDANRDENGEAGGENKSKGAEGRTAPTAPQRGADRRVRRRRQRRRQRHSGEREREEKEERRRGGGGGAQREVENQGAKYPACVCVM